VMFWMSAKRRSRVVSPSLKERSTRTSSCQNAGMRMEFCGPKTGS
jgi:hypothetical protein